MTNFEFWSRILVAMEAREVHFYLPEDHTLSKYIEPMPPSGIRKDPGWQPPSGWLRKIEQVTGNACYDMWFEPGRIFTTRTTSNFYEKERGVIELLPGVLAYLGGE